MEFAAPGRVMSCLLWAPTGIDHHRQVAASSPPQAAASERTSGPNWSPSWVGT